MQVVCSLGNAFPRLNAESATSSEKADNAPQRATPHATAAIRKNRSINSSLLLTEGCQAILNPHTTLHKCPHSPDGFFGAASSIPLTPIGDHHGCRGTASIQSLVAHEHFKAT